jgi:hypothetical protein
MYTTAKDYSMVCKETELTQVMGGFASGAMQRAENAAITEASSHLNFKYDTNAIFGIPAFDYSQTQSYQIGDVVLADNYDNVRTCILAAPAGTPITDDNYFKDDDRRNSLLIMIIMDITIYHLYAALPANRIPEHRKDRYTEAMIKLRDIRKGYSNLKLPLLNQDTVTEEQKNSSIAVLKNKPVKNFHY